MNPSQKRPLLNRRHSVYHVLLKSNLQTQRNFRTKYGRDPLSRSSIRAWQEKFMETGTVFDKGRSASEENRVRNRVTS